MGIVSLDLDPEYGAQYLNYKNINQNKINKLYISLFEFTKKKMEIPENSRKSPKLTQNIRNKQKSRKTQNMLYIFS